MNTQTAERTDRWVRALLWLAGAGFLALIVQAAFTASLAEQGAAIGGLIWGKVTLVDLYLGFGLVFLLLFYLEPSRPRLILFGVLYLFMGNWLLCWYLAWRWPHLRLPHR